MTIAPLSAIPMLLKVLKGCSPLVPKSRAIASEPPMKAPMADTGVPAPRMKGADRTNRWRVKRGTKRTMGRRRKKGKGKGKGTSNPGYHVRHHVRACL
jgi:hypothetical protein